MPKDEQRPCADALAFIARHRLFSSLSEEQRLAFAGIGEAKSFEVGELVVEEDTPGDAFYLVLEGRLKVLKNVPSLEGDKRECIGLLEAGDTFGEMAMLDEEPRSASIEAVKDSRVLEFSTASFHDLLGSHPEAYVCILRNLAHTVADKLRVTGARFAITLFDEKNPPKY